MRDAELIDTIHRKYTAVLMDLDERGTRRWAAAEAMAIGRGGITAVAEATGLARSTVQIGIKELNAPQELAPDRQRRPGGGRKSREHEQPGLSKALEQLVESGTRGDPLSGAPKSVSSSRPRATACSPTARPSRESSIRIETPNSSSLLAASSGTESTASHRSRSTRRRRKCSET